jgi:hypothetical protein
MTLFATASICWMLIDIVLGQRLRATSSNTFDRTMAANSLTTRSEVTWSHSASRGKRRPLHPVKQWHSGTDNPGVELQSQGADDGLQPATFLLGRGHKHRLLSTPSDPPSVPKLEIPT